MGLYSACIRVPSLERFVFKMIEAPINIEVLCFKSFQWIISPIIWTWHQSVSNSLLLSYRQIYAVASDRHLRRAKSRSFRYKDSNSLYSSWRSWLVFDDYDPLELVDSLLCSELFDSLTKPRNLALQVFSLVELVSLSWIILFHDLVANVSSYSKPCFVKRGS